MPEQVIRLPYSVSPKGQDMIPVGNEQVGVIEVPRYHDLTPAERAYIDSELKGAPNLQESLILLTSKISASTGKKMKEIYDAIIDGRILEFADENLSDLFEFQNLQKNLAPTEQFILASAMLLFRVPACAEWTKEIIGDPKVVHPKLLKLLADFARSERNGWDEVAEPPSEETLKKIVPELDSEAA